MPRKNKSLTTWLDTDASAIESLPGKYVARAIAKERRRTASATRQKAIPLAKIPTRAAARQDSARRSVPRGGSR